MEIGIGHYLSVGAILFTLGIFGIFLNRKNVIVILMSIELMLLAVNLNLVAFSNNRAVAGDGSYLIGLLPREQVLRVVDYARAQGVLRYAALAPDTPYGHQVVDDLAEAVAAIGGTLVRTGFFADEPDDMSRAVRDMALYDTRLAALSAHREQVKGMIAEWQQALTLLNSKIDFYDEWVASGKRPAVKAVKTIKREGSTTKPRRAAKV